MMFWIIVGIGVFAVALCTVVGIAILMANKRSNFD